MFSGAVGKAGRSPSLRCTPTSKPAKNARHASGTERGSRWYWTNIWSMYSALARLTKSNDAGGGGGDGGGCGGGAAADVWVLVVDCGTDAGESGVTTGSVKNARRWLFSSVPARAA